MSCKHKLFLNKNKKKKQMVSFYILRNFSWMQAYVPFSPAGMPVQMIRVLSFWEKFLISIPHPIPNAKIPRNESWEKDRQNIFIKISLWGTIITNLLRNPIGLVTGITIILLLLLTLFCILCVFLPKDIFTDSPLFLLYVA